MAINPYPDYEAGAKEFNAVRLEMNDTARERRQSIFQVAKETSTQAMRLISHDADTGEQTDSLYIFEEHRRLGDGELSPIQTTHEVNRLDTFLQSIGIDPLSAKENQISIPVWRPRQAAS